MPIRINDIRIRPVPKADQAAFQAALARLRVREAEVISRRILKKSVDARDKGDIRLVYSLEITLAGDEKALLSRLSPDAGQWAPPSQPIPWPKTQAAFRPVVAGLGPCGLFAALLLARAGLSPLSFKPGEQPAVWRRGRRRLF